MRITYKNKKMEKICNNASAAKKEYGSRMADIIHLRHDQIKAADSIDLMVEYKIGRCHELKGNRANQFAVDLVQPFRMVFEKKGDEIQIAHILEIVDYH